jgi:lipopolysaccharide export system protein LptA
MIKTLNIGMLLATIGLLQASAHAQGIGLPNQARKQPIEIDADNSIEWRQNSQAYIARGNAKAKQGDVFILADQLTAYYKKQQSGRLQIWRLDADGNVRIVSPRQKAFGTKGVYNVTKGIFVLTGTPRLITETERISASKSLEFWEKKSMAIARGNAIAVKDDKTLRADILTALFQKTESGKSEIVQVNAYHNVSIRSPKEIIRGKRGIYNTKTGIVILHGGVKITRGPDQLNGDSAEVNLKTGISRLLSSGKRKVRGLFGPKKFRPGGKTTKRQ